MGTVAIYDYDFFNYKNVIPNLECAKLVTYYRNHNQIALLAPALNPQKYTKFIVRKEYNDGIFPREFFLPNCEYGGRAFNPEQYIPLEKGIEDTIPDMHIYDKYVSHFGTTPTDEKCIKRILNCAHIRLAPNSQDMVSLEKLKKNFIYNPTGIIFHDYNLAKLKPYDLIKELQDQRTFVTKEGINPYPVGNKFPIKIYDSEELQKWLKIETIPNAFYLEYCGYMSDEVLYNLCEQNKRMAKQVYYNITYACSTENDFLVNRLEKIFIQTLFLRKNNIKILLKYDEGFFVTEELENLVKLLNYWLSFKWHENFLPKRQTLYELCRNHKRLQYTNWAFQTIKLTTEQLRNIFQYIREKNYELFKMFYECDLVNYKEGKFLNDWTRN